MDLLRFFKMSWSGVWLLGILISSTLGSENSSSSDNLTGNTYDIDFGLSSGVCETIGTPLACIFPSGIDCIASLGVCNVLTMAKELSNLSNQTTDDESVKNDNCNSFKGTFIKLSKNKKSLLEVSEKIQPLEKLSDYNMNQMTATLERLKAVKIGLDANQIILNPVDDFVYCNITGEIKTTFYDVFNNTQEYIKNQLKNFIGNLREKQQKLLGEGITLALKGDIVKHLVGLRSKFDLMMQNSKRKENEYETEDVQDFIKSASECINGAEISDQIYQSVTGTHPFQLQSIYSNSSLCNLTMKDVYNNLMMEAFLYYSIAVRLAGKRVSRRRMDKLETQFVQHESHFFLMCGCTLDQQLGNRGNKLTSIFNGIKMYLNQRYADDEFFHSVVNLVNRNETKINIYNLKVLSVVAKLDFNNSELMDIISSTPTEDIGLLVELVVLTDDVNETNRILELMTNTTACYKLEKGYKNHIWQNGNFYGGFWNHTSRSGYGIMTFNKDIYCYSVGYEGMWVDDKMDGQGTFYWTDESVYQGQWKEGKKNGSGTHRYSPYNIVKVKEYEGQWKNNQRHGPGILKWNNGESLTSTFHKNIPNGNVTYLWNDNSYFKGIVDNGVFKGFGTLSFQVNETGTNKTDVAYWLTDHQKEINLIWQDLSDNQRVWRISEILTGNGTSIDRKTQRVILMNQNSNSYEGNLINFTGCGKVTYSDSTEYEGELVDGIKQGKGVSFLADGIYEGNHINNEISGEGKYTFSNEQVLIGHFKRGQLNEEGTIKWPNGDSYTGGMSSNRMSGQGIYTYADGRTLLGIFENGSLPTVVTLTYPNGEKYVGELNNNQMNGNGQFSWSNGDIYEGQFINNFRTGQGIFTFVDGRKYQGAFDQNKFSGLGKYTWPDGRNYTGNFQNNLKVGNGVLHWPNGQKYEGNFENDQINNFGTLTWPNGKKYRGKFKNNKRHGNGTFEWPEGDKYEGEFIEDCKSGKGTYTFTDGRIYEGEFENDEFFGLGTLIIADLFKYTGQFKHNKRQGKGTLEWAEENFTTYFDDSKKPINEYNSSCSDGNKYLGILETHNFKDWHFVALKGGSSFKEGNIFAMNPETQYFGPICDDDWDMNSAKVACRQLGFSQALNFTMTSKYGPVNEKFSYDQVICTGSESRVDDCPHANEEDCGGGEGAGVICN